MSRIRGRDTKPELKLKNFFEEKGFIYQAQEYGKPDFIHYTKKIVIFIDGCFWHKCPQCFKLPETNIDFWENKINGNLRRDKEVTLNYTISGWQVIRIWTHDLKKFLNKKVFSIL